MTLSLCLYLQTFCLPRWYFSCFSTEAAITKCSFYGFCFPFVAIYIQLWGTVTSFMLLVATMDSSITVALHVIAWRSFRMRIQVCAFQLLQLCPHNIQETRILIWKLIISSLGFISNLFLANETKCPTKVKKKQHVHKTWNLVTDLKRTHIDNHDGNFRTK